MPTALNTPANPVVVVPSATLFYDTTGVGQLRIVAIRPYAYGAGPMDSIENTCRTKAGYMYKAGTLHAQRCGLAPQE